MGSMARQSTPKPDDPAQSQRFRELAKALEADDDVEALKNLETVVRKLADLPPEPRRKLGRATAPPAKRKRG